MPTVGWIDYLNLLPLKAELQTLLGVDFAGYYGHPAEVNERIRRGLVDVAPASSVCLTEPAFFEMKLPLGVCGDGPVDSVTLTARDEAVYRRLTATHEAACDRLADGPLANVEQVRLKQGLAQEDSGEPLLTVYFTLASETSRALAKIIWQLWFGRDPVRVDDPKAADVVLRIGDSALWAKEQSELHFDLGQLWKDLTGLPFVFAVWQGTPGAVLPPDFCQLVLEAAKTAEEKMRLQPALYFDYLPVFDDRQKKVVADYWSRIHYSLHPMHMRALRLFLNLVAGADGAPQYPLRAPLRAQPATV